jgi:hypothetical protein
LSIKQDKTDNNCLQKNTPTHPSHILAVTNIDGEYTDDVFIFKSRNKSYENYLATNTGGRLCLRTAVHKPPFMM